MSKFELLPEDYYEDENGNMVFTEKYHLKRGFCCKSGCRHCPFGFGEDFDPELPIELHKAEVEHEISADDLLEMYSEFNEEE